MANGKGGFIGQDGLNAPDPATGVSASGGDAQATVSFTAPSRRWWVGYYWVSGRNQLTVLARPVLPRLLLSLA